MLAASNNGTEINLRCVQREGRSSWTGAWGVHAVVTVFIISTHFVPPTSRLQGKSNTLKLNYLHSSKLNQQWTRQAASLCWKLVCGKSGFSGRYGGGPSPHLITVSAELKWSVSAVGGVLAERAGHCSFCLADYWGVGWRRWVGVEGGRHWKVFWRVMSGRRRITKM